MKFHKGHCNFLALFVAPMLSDCDIHMWLAADLYSRVNGCYFEVYLCHKQTNDANYDFCC